MEEEEAAAGAHGPSASSPNLISVTSACKFLIVLLQFVCISDKVHRILEAALVLLGYKFIREKERTYEQDSEADTHCNLSILLSMPLGRKLKPLQKK